MESTKITLQEGQTYAIARGDFIRVEGWLVTGQSVGLDVSLSGSPVTNKPNQSQVYVMNLPERSEIIVRPVGGGEFPPDHSVSISVTQPGTAKPEVVSFPHIRLDGFAERVVGELVPAADDTITIRVFGSTIAHDLSRAAMTMVSALRLAQQSSVSLSNLQVYVDASAAMLRSVTDEELCVVDDVITGVADYYDMAVVGDNLSATSRESHPRYASVGAAPLSIEAGAGLVIVTHSPRPHMAQYDAATVVIVVGPNSQQEVEHYQQSYQRDYPVAMIALPPNHIAALLAGEHNTVAAEAAVIAQALSTGNPAGIDPQTSIREGTPPPNNTITDAASQYGTPPHGTEESWN